MAAFIVWVLTVTRANRTAATAAPINTSGLMLT